LAALGLFASLAGAAAPGSVDADITGLRSAKGQVLACLTTRADRFPDCQKDPNARRVTVATSTARTLRFDGLPSGDYALALIHDENGNGRLDTMMGIPREGFGFSRNPVIRFGPPKFSEASISVTSGAVDENVKVKYLL
jgi:uncharacterized protein (DUF2141 family)